MTQPNGTAQLLQTFERCCQKNFVVVMTSVEPEGSVEQMLLDFVAEISMKPPFEPPVLCVCGHTWHAAHRTPGTECAIFGCECSRFERKA